MISFPGREEEAQRVATRGTCTVRDTGPPPFMDGGHPQKSFFGPGETAPIEDLTHVLGDGFVIVRYRPDLQQRQLAALERFAASGELRYVIAAPDPKQKRPLRALTASQELSCRTVDTQALTGFRDDWLASRRQ